MAGRCRACLQFVEGGARGHEDLGAHKVTPREEEKGEKQRKMDHYFYHCERNPDGFARLKIENFEKDAGERVRAEAAALASKDHP